MQSRWNEIEAAKFKNDLLAMRAYTSRLLGQESALVQHGGGNTSVKITRENLFGEKEDVLYVKGSGWDLASIEPQGFAPVKMDVLLRMARLETLSDADMVREQKAAQTNPAAPTPSVEAILHAIIPMRYVEHTHSDAVVTLTNTPNAKELVREAFGDRVMVVPYVMPGFVLARKIFECTRDINWDQLDGIVLLNHGVFTFHDDARTAYENMIRLVTKAETVLEKHKALSVRTATPAVSPSAIEMADLRRRIADKMGRPVLLRLNATPEATGFASWEKVTVVSAKGTVTPDHVIHIKPKPIVFSASPKDDIERYSNEYASYFSRHAKPGVQRLDAAPRWGIWPGRGCLNIAVSAKALRVVDDITTHTRRCMQWSEALGGYQPVTEADLFDVEYWELEQAKLKVGAGNPELQGKIAIVTGAASGIGRAIAVALKAQGACVAAFDINPGVVDQYKGDGTIGIVCDVTSGDSLDAAVKTTAQYFGGLDILVANAGTFPPGKSIQDLDEADWSQGLNLNLSAHWRTMKAVIPLLKLGFDASIVIVGSKNVPAPGPGAAVYSSAKAGLTQLGRVAALELAPHGVRVNTVHPDAVFDTGIWNEEVIANRAKHYNLSVEQYKTKNLLKTEITAKNVAQLVLAMVGPAFGKTTGAQIPIDGGNDRVI